MSEQHCQCKHCIESRNHKTSAILSELKCGREKTKPEKQFSVIAGKHDGQDLNCKYSADFDTLDQAIEAYDKVSVYPWAYIQYKNRTIDVWEEGNNPLGE